MKDMVHEGDGGGGGGGGGGGHGGGGDGDGGVVTKVVELKEVMLLKEVVEMCRCKGSGMVVVVI